jgi:hypothetical protein
MLALPHLLVYGRRQCVDRITIPSSIAIRSAANGVYGSWITRDYLCKKISKEPCLSTTIQAPSLPFFLLRLEKWEGRKKAAQQQCCSFGNEPVYAVACAKKTRKCSH